MSSKRFTNLEYSSTKRRIRISRSIEDLKIMKESEDRREEQRGMKREKGGREARKRKERTAAYRTFHRWKRETGIVYN